MSDEINAADSTAPDVSRRESIRLAAALALGAGLGSPTELLAMAPVAGQLQIKFYKGPTEGGALLGGVPLTDAITSFIASLAGANTQIKWYNGLGQELGTMGIPTVIQSKVRLAMPSGE